jgi:two-component system, OmpR family, phosphate regulon sensor histidine kinase PhoR
MLKNYSPRIIALLTAVCSFLLVFVVNYIFFHTLFNTILVAAIVGIVVYFLVWYYVQEVLDKKIQTIYKFINQTKAGKREQFYQKNLLPRPSLDNVYQDVENWAIKNTEDFELLEKNEQYRKEFLQNLSHELKTPLFSMQGYVESLLGGALHDDKVNERFLKNTAGNINRLIDLVNDLDAITKLENETNLLTYTSFSINELMQEAFAVVAIKASEKNIYIGFKSGTLQNRKVIADRAKIAQVLSNLLENAIKYGKEGGLVTANIDTINTDVILVEISDNGHGIAEEHLDRIFERFYRTDLARARKVGGSGLGLAICKHIIEAHQQTIHVRSNINVGTTFRFTLKKG